tara:strand:+ start:3784 stop:4635 length:852 start_codon:yes stop_codon:yes gene_type:complete
MSNTQILIFSKERTLQLNSLIQSLLYYSDVSQEDITVLFKDSEDISYKSLINKYSCNFRQEKSFLTDVKNIIQNNKKQYCMFLVDDFIVRDNFSIGVMESVLRSPNGITAFSLRLGSNIKDHQSPEFVTLPDSVLSWRTNKKYGKSWNYIWELSSSMYESSFVANYLSQCDPEYVDFPNPLESYYYGCNPSQYVTKNRLLRKLKFLGKYEAKGMAAFSISKGFTQGVNLVANRDLEYKDLYTPKFLHEKFLNGYGIDYISLKNINNEKPNAGRSHFKLIKYES